MINDRCKDFEEKNKRDIANVCIPRFGILVTSKPRGRHNRAKNRIRMRKIDLRFNELRITLFRNIKFQVYI